MADPKPHPVVQAATERLLKSAERYYRSADLGIDALPLEVRGGVRGARALYAEIGTVIARAGFDSVSSRAVTSRKRKVLALGREWLRTRLTNRLGRRDAQSEPTAESRALIGQMVPYENPLEVTG